MGKNKILISLTDKHREKLAECAARAGMTIQELMQEFIDDLTECNNENYDDWVLLDNWIIGKRKVNIVRYCVEELGDINYFYRSICIIESLKSEINSIEENGIFLDDLPKRRKELEIEEKGLEEDFKRFSDWAQKLDSTIQIDDLETELEKIESWHNEYDIFENGYLFSLYDE